MASMEVRIFDVTDAYVHFVAWNSFLRSGVILSHEQLHELVAEVERRRIHLQDFDQAWDTALCCP
jgi:hypothetical protein